VSDNSPETNHKNIPPPRPLLHLPPLLLPLHNLSGLGLRIRRRLHTNPTHLARLHIRTLPPALPRHRNALLLPRRSAPRARWFLSSPSAARPLQLERSRWWQGRAGIRVLLGCGDTRICTGLGVFVCRAVLVHAACWNGTLVRQNPLNMRRCWFRVIYQPLQEAVHRLKPKPFAYSLKLEPHANYASRVSEVLSNTLYLIALNYYFIITFLGYNALPFLHHTELLLAPIAVTTILWFASLFGFNMSRHLAPVLWAGARLRKSV
jgi:hypothetical protein